MSDITITTVSPLSGTPSVSVGGNLSVYSDFSCGGGLTLSSGNITVTGQSVFQSGFTSASLLTCNSTPVSSDHLVTKSYVDGLLYTNRLYYSSSVALSGTGIIALEPGNYTFYVELNACINCTVSGAATVTTGRFIWPSFASQGSELVVDSSSTISTVTPSPTVRENVIIPIKISNVSITSAVSGQFSFSVSPNVGALIANSASCTVYVTKNS
jgi:hypothetical protein